MTWASLLNRAAELRDRAVLAGPVKLCQLIVVVDPKVHDSPRHFAMCSERADEIRVAPQLADLPAPMIDGILMHELGHAADFAYPARWRVWHGLAYGSADPRRFTLRLFGHHTPTGMRAWKRRDPYAVEHAADQIAEAMFKVRIGYVGPLMLQSTEGGVRPRPFGI